MAQNIYFYNNTSLAEAITDASAIVGKSTTSNIVDFQSKYANVYDIPYNYDNIVQYTGNANKVTWETVNGKQTITSNNTVESTGNITAEVNGVLCLLGIADVFRQVSLAFGLKESVKVIDRNTWGYLYPSFQALCANKNLSESALERARIACTVDANGKLRVPENFIDDVASALASAQMTQNNHSKIFEVGQQISRGNLGLNNDWTVGFKAFNKAYSHISAEKMNFWHKVVSSDVVHSAYANLLRICAQEHIDYDSIVYQIYTDNPLVGSAWAEFTAIATAVKYEPTVTIETKTVTGTNAISYTITSDEVTAIKSFKVTNHYDWVYEQYTKTAEVIETTSAYKYVLGYGTSTNDYEAVSIHGSSTTVEIGDPPENFDYIGDPLSIAPWREQYPAWALNALNGLLPIGYNQDLGADPQANAQEGNIEDVAPYPWEETLPVPDIDPIDPNEPPLEPDGPDPKPDFPPLPIEIPEHDANKLFSVHTIDANNMNTLGGYLWSSSFASLIEHMFSEPIHAVLGLHELHYGGTISVGSSEEIKLGAFGSGAQGKLVTNRYLEFSCGSINVKEHYGNVEDYDPYTKLQLYLPYVGFVPIATNEVMGKKLTVKYGIDVYTGGCVARVIVTNNGVEQELYNFQGQCGCQLPVTSADYSSLVSRPLIGAALGAVTGGAVGAITGGLGGLASARIDYSRTNGFNSNTGVMLRQKPMLIIERPIAFNAQSYPSFYGNPTNWTVTLSECSGYTRVKDIHIDKTKSTDEEKLEIERLLKEGVIL